MHLIKKILSNKTRVWLAPLHETKAFTIMIFFKVGSRNESASINGISHFLEHLFFKGTSNRPSTLDISKELDGVGADFNAFTGKESTAYYIKVNAEHQELAIDMLSDMLHNSLFEPKEIERERGVILEEINMYRDNPIMHIEDVFEETLFHGDPMGRNIAGPPSVIKKVPRTEIIRYRKKYYQPKNTVIAVAGNFEPKRVLRLLEKHFDHERAAGQASIHPRFRQIARRPRVAIDHRKTNQTQLALGVHGLPFGHPDLPAMAVLSTVLGGNMSSRLFIQIRERRGLCYSIRSSISPYDDTGAFVIRAGLENTRLREAIHAILHETSLLKKTLVDADELHKAKEYIKGKMILNFEDSENIADFIGFQELYRNRVQTPEQKLKAIIDVTAEDVRAIANKFFLSKSLTLAIIGPAEKREAPSYEKLLQFE